MSVGEWENPSPLLALSWGQGSFGCNPAAGRERSSHKKATDRQGAESDVLWADGFFSLLQGGFGILEEMCVNYIHYYPKTELELCKSAVDDGSLQKYFHIVNR